MHLKQNLFKRRPETLIIVDIQPIGTVFIFQIFELEKRYFYAYTWPLGEVYTFKTEFILKRISSLKINQM